MERSWILDAGDVASASAARREFAAFIAGATTPNSDVDAAVTVFAELIVNAVQHGVGPVRAHVGPGEKCAVLCVEDDGPGFVLEEVRAPTSWTGGGRGIFLSRRLARSLRVTRIEGDGCRVTAELPIRLAQ